MSGDTCCAVAEHLRTVIDNSLQAAQSEAPPETLDGWRQGYRSGWYDALREVRAELEDWS